MDLGSIYTVRCPDCGDEVQVDFEGRSDPENAAVLIIVPSLFSFMSSI